MNEIAIIRDAFACGINDWMDIWGDPLLSGSIFVISYGVTAWLILRAANLASGRERSYWRLCGLLFAFQLFNTNLDLHALVWTIGRCLAHAQGWYEHRREVQLLFLAGLALLLGLVLLAVLVMFFRHILHNLLLTLGVAIALGFTLVKGINYHHVERFYGAEVGPFHVADFIEYSGIVLALIAALMRLNKSRAAPANAGASVSTRSR